MTSCSGRDDWSSILDCTRCVDAAAGHRLRHRTQRGRTLRRGIRQQPARARSASSRSSDCVTKRGRLSVSGSASRNSTTSCCRPARCRSTVLEREVDAYIALKRRRSRGGPQPHDRHARLTATGGPMALFQPTSRYAVRRWAARPGPRRTRDPDARAGIGTATAIFSVVDSVLLRPLVA